MTQARLDALDEVQESEGDCVAALPLFQEAIEIESAALGEDASARMRTSYGQCLTRLERYSEAEEQLLAAYGGLRERENPAGVRRALAGLVRLYKSWGKRELVADYRALLEEADTLVTPER